MFTVLWKPLGIFRIFWYSLDFWYCTQFVWSGRKIQLPLLVPYSIEFDPQKDLQESLKRPLGLGVRAFSKLPWKLSALNWLFLTLELRVASFFRKGSRNHQIKVKCNNLIKFHYLLMSAVCLQFQVLIYQNFCFHFVNQRESAQPSVLVNCWNWSKHLRRTSMLWELREKSLPKISTCQKHR